MPLLDFISQALNIMESMYAEIFDALEAIRKKSLFSGVDHSRSEEFHNHFLELKELLKREKIEYEVSICDVSSKRNEPSFANI